MNTLYVERDGKIFPNPALLNSIPYEWTFDDQGGDNLVLIPANGMATRILSNDRAASLDLLLLKGTATTTDLLISIYDIEFSRYLANGPLHWETIVGTNKFPYQFSIPLVIGKTQTLKMEFTNLTNAQSTARVVLAGFKDFLGQGIPMPRGRRRIYWYTTENAITLPNSSDSQFAYITITTADFAWRWTSAKSDGPFKIKITNQSTGLDYANGWIHSDTWAGTSQNYLALEPRLLTERAQLKLEIINLHNATNRVFITLSGENYYHES